jgi:hypothetical protein
MRKRYSQPEGDAELACRLIERATYKIPQAADDLRRCTYVTDEQKLARAMEYLEALATVLDERAPDEDWWGDYFSLTGQHMVLTEEGWEPAEPVKADPEIEILDEVNAPEEKSSCQQT